jgi:hypothetical protein
MSGIRNIKQIAKQYTEAEIYFHQDLDGITSCLAMKSFLKRYGIITVETHIIQYGSLEFNIRKIKNGRLPVIVDFAHIKDMFVIATDHHQSQAGGGDTYSTNFKKSRCNVETISNEIGVNIFTDNDIELIRCIDSADFYNYNLTPEDIHNCVTPTNRFKLGLLVNRLLLAYKNKRIKIDKYNNKNILECLALECEPSLYSIYTKLLYYIKNAISYEWNFDLKTYFDRKRLETPEQLNNNLNNYIQTRLGNDDIRYNDEYKIILQYNIGKPFSTGSYDRYIAFRLYPQANYICTIFEDDLIQISANPFIKNDNNINLGDITKELLDKYKNLLLCFRISLTDIKRINESESNKLKKKYTDFEPMGFNFDDLKTFYKDCVYVNKTDKINLDDAVNIKTIFNKLYSDWTFNDKEDMNEYKISALSIISVLSGGHKFITNIQGIKFLIERKDAMIKYFGNTSYVYKEELRYIKNINDLMIFFTNEFLNILKNKLKTGHVAFTECSVI